MLKRVLITSKCTQNAPFLCKFLKNFRGRPPDPHLQEGVTPSLPLSALRTSVKPSDSLVTCAPPPPGQWRFWIRPWRMVIKNKFLKSVFFYIKNIDAALFIRSELKRYFEKSCIELKNIDNLFFFFFFFLQIINIKKRRNAIIPMYNLLYFIPNLKGQLWKRPVAWH